MTVVHIGAAAVALALRDQAALEAYLKYLDPYPGAPHKAAGHPGRARVPCGARRSRCPIAAYERAPAATAQTAARTSARSGYRRPRRARGSTASIPPSPSGVTEHDSTSAGMADSRNSEALLLVKDLRSPSPQPGFGMFGHTPTDLHHHKIATTVQEPWCDDRPTTSEHPEQDQTWLHSFIESASTAE